MPNPTLQRSFATLSPLSFALGPPITISDVHRFPKSESDVLEKIKKFAGRARDAISSTAVLVGDLNGDGKVDEEDARIAAEWAKRTTSSVGEEAARLGKEAIRSDLAKDAATGAAIGAVVAVPIPIIGPLAGAAIGAGLGVYKNFTKKEKPAPATVEHSPAVDIHAELLKLDDLRQKSIITEAEFEAQKKQVLLKRA